MSKIEVCEINDKSRGKKITIVDGLWLRFVLSDSDG